MSQTLQCFNSIELVGRPGIPAAATSVAGLKALLIRWLSVNHLSIQQATSPEIRQLLEFTSPQYFDALPSSPHTIRSWLIEEYKMRHEAVRKALKRAASQIHLSFDLWTSGNHMALLGIVAHFTLDEEVVNLLLGLRRLRGSHNGENIADAVIDTVDTYQIDESVGCFILDNASSNDVAAHILSAKYHPNEPPSRYRLRCLGHILNLAAKAMLYGGNEAVFDLIEESTDDLDVWRRTGPVAKLHFIVSHVRRGPKRLSTYLSCALRDEEDVDLIPKADNKTRWNSTWLMIERALKVRGRLTGYITKQIAQKELAEDFTLTDDDWGTLTELHSLLKPFEFLTRRMEGHGTHGQYGAVWEVLPAMEVILQHLEHAKEQLQIVRSPDRTRQSEKEKKEDAEELDARHYLEVGGSLAWDKIDEYSLGVLHGT